jgi:hypothetical protein
MNVERVRYGTLSDRGRGHLFLPFDAELGPPAAVLRGMIDIDREVLDRMVAAAVKTGCPVADGPVRVRLSW